MPRLESKMVIVVVISVFRLFFPLSVHISSFVFVRIMCWKCVVVSRFLFFFFALRSTLAGEPKYEENWKELAKMLNNTLGPKKSVEEWKMVKEQNS